MLILCRNHFKGLICIKDRSQTTVSSSITCLFRYPNICRQDIFSCLVVEIQGVYSKSPPIILGLPGTGIMCSHQILPLIDSNDYLWAISIATTPALKTSFNNGGDYKGPPFQKTLIVLYLGRSLIIQITLSEISMRHQK